MILLDTCVIIWDALAPSELSANARQAIADADEQQALFISDISIWEIAMLVRKGRLEIDSGIADFTNLFIQSRNISVKHISPDIAEMSVNLPADFNKDPADRIISATAIVHRAQLVTADQHLRENRSLRTIW